MGPNGESRRPSGLNSRSRMSLAATVSCRDDLWVFGYGSLMWRPGFDYVESALAWVHGYHRSLCIFSHVHRGTPERPGLVLGLDKGGSCQGVAFRVAAKEREKTVQYLRERELVTAVYLEKTVGVRFAEGGCANALAYVVDRSHCQYAGRLPYDEMTKLIAEGCGLAGDNPAYVRNTYEHLLQLDIHDAELAEVVRRLDQCSCRAAPAQKKAGANPGH
ncbi:gamma-glutamylcyclotransferase [Methylocystis sp. Sn-Cys]|nr:gamma-glutamylcyclotransferase [Methylocystis sp. Sn-Cys]